MSEKSSSKSTAPYKRPNKNKKNETILGTVSETTTKLTNLTKKLRKGDTLLAENMETNENYDA